tara:strand:+ start:115 stop:270 length:156 start_codon:yes stop_codon:yes gene_type:complete
MLLYLLPQKGHVAQLNSALDYGSRGCWFESSHGHKKKKRLSNLIDNRFFIL